MTPQLMQRLRSMAMASTQYECVLSPAEVSMIVDALDIMPDDCRTHSPGCLCGWCVEWESTKRAFVMEHPKGYPKLNIDRVIASEPSLSIGDMAALAVFDHTRTDGCAFEADAAVRAVRACGLDPDGKAVDLSEGDRIRLGRALEALEVDCAHKGDAP